MKLLIVESPAKARTLKRLLRNLFSDTSGQGKVDIAVEATLGHVKDLPKSKLGVNVEKDFKPTYVVLPGKKKVLQKLTSLAARASEIYLGPDPDREGEAIAWHVAEEIKKKDKQKNIKRVLFHEITPQAVREAITNPTELDLNKYTSQQTRRILDRLVGYQISPLLWEKVKRGLSAGRVQSVALRLICERERAISNFVPEEYWEIVARFISESARITAETQDKPTFEAKLIKISGKKAKITTEAQAQEILNALAIIRNEKGFVVEKVVKKERRRHPLPPFITSTMQQEAAKKLGFSAKKTMMIAQQLYEGIDLGKQSDSEQEVRVGLITYMRTDSVRTADVALKEVREFINQTWGKEFLPKQPYLYKNKKSAQDAHEAIRPTSIYRTPEAVAPYLTPDQRALYALIWRRFVASQMAAAIYDQTTVDIRADRFLFRGTASILKFPGFQRVYSEDVTSPTEKEQDRILPPLEEGQRLECQEIIPSQHFTKPPPRYTEASLIKELEEKGIGRPSTYATILSTIQERKYVVKEGGKFKPTELGLLVNDLLVENFPDIVDVSFTAKMEENLDAIEEGKAHYLETLKSFYQIFSKALKQAQKQMLNVKAKGIETDIICEKCGAKMVIKYGKSGAFLACSQYPKCKNTKEFTRNEKGEIVILESEIPKEACPLCGSPLVLKHGRYGSFLACSNYPDCKFTKELKAGAVGGQGASQTIEKKCPRCGAPLVIKRNKKGGRFLACSRYPECKYAAPLTLGFKCPKCEQGEIVEQVSKKGRVFYSCSRYPECKFAMWEQPIANPCPKCRAEFRVIKGKKLVCLKCGYKEEVDGG